MVHSSFAYWIFNFHRKLQKLKYFHPDKMMVLCVCVWMPVAKIRMAIENWASVKTYETRTQKLNERLLNKYVYVSTCIGVLMKS